MNDLEKRFTSHKVDKPETLQFIRESCLALAKIIEELLPPGREQALALTRLEEVMLWANAGYSRNRRRDNG